MESKNLQFDNLDTYNRVVHEYRKYELNPPERNILSLFKDKWHKIRMLDIGAGAGRTSYTFSAIVKEYTGIDYSPPMVQECKRIIEETDTIKFEICDASDLSRYYKNKFDFILFSLNGIDSVDHDTRLRILSEVRKILHEDGHFFFSTHSLHNLIIGRDIFRFNRKELLKSIYCISKDLHFALRLKWFYRNTNPEEIKKKPWAIIITGDHNFKMKVYHIRPEVQLDQLEKAGFNTISVYDKEGQLIDPLNNNASGMIYFLCKPD